jgi:uncharacterized membrane protein YqjE
MDTQTPGRTAGEARFAREDDRSVADLIKDLSRQTQTLVRQELELAQAELTEKGRAAGIGAGMLGGAGVVGLFAFGALTACAILALDLAMAAWLAALIVFAIYAAIAGVLALVGRGKLRQATPAAPERARESVRADVASVKAHAQAGRG